MAKEILPCPFCGKIPDGIETWHFPASLSIECKNEDCYVRPCIQVPVECKTNPDGWTYTPLFGKRKDEIVDKWNKRA